MLEAAIIQNVTRTGSPAPKHTAHVPGERAFTEAQGKAIQMQGAQMAGLSL